MKSVLRELLILTGWPFLVANWLKDHPAINRSGVVSQAFWLTYSDLQDLQPAFAAVSWRGAVAKGVAAGWLRKRLTAGQRRFQITQFGVQVLESEFPPMTHFLAPFSHEWTLCLLQPQVHSEVQASPARLILRQAGAARVASGIYVWPFKFYDAELVKKLVKLGYFAEFMLVNSQQGQPFPLREWVSLTIDNPKQRRQWGHYVIQMQRLLTRLRQKKVVSKQDKSHFGQLLLSGMAEIHDYSWLDFGDDQSRHDLHEWLLVASESYEALWPSDAAR